MTQSTPSASLLALPVLMMSRPTYILIAGGRAGSSTSPLFCLSPSEIILDISFGKKHQLFLVTVHKDRHTMCKYVPNPAKRPPRTRIFCLGAKQSDSRCSLKNEPIFTQNCLNLYEIIAMGTLASSCSLWPKGTAVLGLSLPFHQPSLLQLRHLSQNSVETFRLSDFQSLV